MLNGQNKTNRRCVNSTLINMSAALSFAIAIGITEESSASEVKHGFFTDKHPVAQYLAMISTTGPRLHDCRLGAELDPRYRDSFPYGLMLARWTDFRRLYHGTAHGSFKMKELRLPSFFGTREFYPSVHVVGQYNFPKALQAENFRHNILDNTLQPKFYSYEIKSSVTPDFIYGYEFWPEKMIDTMISSNILDDQQKKIYEMELKNISGVGAGRKKVPANVASARFMSNHLGSILGSDIKGTIARRKLPFGQVQLLTNAAFVRQYPSDRTLMGTGNKVIPEEKLMRALKVSHTFNKLTAKNKKYKPLDRFVIPTKPDAAQFGYDEVVLFKETKLLKPKVKKVSQKATAFLDVLAQWNNKECDAVANKKIAFSLDYRQYFPFLGKGPEEKKSQETNLQYLFQESTKPNRNITTVLHRYTGQLLNDLKKDVAAFSSKDKKRKKQFEKTSRELISLIDLSHQRVLSGKEVGLLRVAARSFLDNVYCNEKTTAEYCKNEFIDDGSKP